MNAITKNHFCDLVQKYKRGLFLAARCIVRNDEDAEDAVSEAIYKAFRGMGSLRNISSFKAWIYRITLNEAYVILRKRKSTVDIDAYEEIPAPDEAEEQGLIEYVNRLKEELRAPVYLFYYEDMRISDIAKILDIPVNTVKSRLRRGKETLQRMLPEGEMQHEF